MNGLFERSGGNNESVKNVCSTPTGPRGGLSATGTGFPGRGPCFFSQPNAGLFKGNQLFFVQVSDGFLKCLFADAEKINDFFWWAFIRYRNKPALPM